MAVSTRATLAIVCSPSLTTYILLISTAVRVYSSPWTCQCPPQTNSLCRRSNLPSHPLQDLQQPPKHCYVWANWNWGGMFVCSELGAFFFVFLAKHNHLNWNLQLYITFFFKKNCKSPNMKFYTKQLNTGGLHAYKIKATSVNFSSRWVSTDFFFHSTKI